MDMWGQIRGDPVKPLRTLCGTILAAAIGHDSGARGAFSVLRELRCRSWYCAVHAEYGIIRDVG